MRIKLLKLRIKYTLNPRDYQGILKNEINELSDKVEKQQIEIN